MIYVPLWCKSNFSFLEGASHPEELVEEARRPRLARAGAHRPRRRLRHRRARTQKARELGVHLIVGAQVTVSRCGEPSSSCSPRIARATRICAGCSPRAACAARKARARVTLGRGLRARAGSARALGRRAQPAWCARPEPRAAGRCPIGQLREAFGDRLYAMAARHRRDAEVAQEARLRARAARYGVPLVAAVEVLYHSPCAPRLCRTCSRASATA